ncbi:rod shape-determining protein RodA, partial [Patescibacteria group bacterium]|nr:rod shape-determining protein RodA [Patescibacteria group bacterium]
LRKFDWLLFLPVFVLGIIGLVAIYSSDLAKTDSDFTNFKKQLIMFALGFLVFFIISILNYRQFRNAKNLLYLLGLGLLVGVLFFGKTLRGTTGWFILGPFSFQPVEIVKIILVIFLADYFSREGRNLFGFGNIIKSLIAVLIFVALVMRQPDMGSAVILFLVWLGMLLTSRVQKKHLLILFLLFIIVSASLWFFVLHDYQKNRIKVFVNPELDPLRAGYNIKQSIIAVGSGGFFGKGLGFGSQSQLRFLPEAHTDFIFALIAEEMGFVIVALILGLYALFFLRILKIARESKNDFTAYLAIGFLIVFMSETVINIGMNLGLMPVTGLALPFMSLGGSALVSNFIMVGMLESVRLRSQ